MQLGVKNQYGGEYGVAQSWADGGWEWRGVMGRNGGGIGIVVVEVVCLVQIRQAGTSDHLTLTRKEALGVWAKVEVVNTHNWKPRIKLVGGHFPLGSVRHNTWK